MTHTIDVAQALHHQSFVMSRESRRPESRPTMPAPKLEDIEAFERRIKEVGEWHARLERLGELLTER